MNQDQIIAQFNELNQLILKQDKITSQLLDLFTEYRRNHQAIYLLQQKLRSVITGVECSELKVNQLYVLSDDSSNWVLDTSIINHPQDLIGYHLKFDELYNDLIGGQKFYEFNNIYVKYKGKLDIIYIGHAHISFNNYEFEEMEETITYSVDEYELTQTINKQLRIVSYSIEADNKDIEFIGFNVKEKNVL